MKRNLLLSFMLVLGLATLSAQELNCRIQFNTDKIQGTNKQVFTTLQGALMDFMNNKKWTNASFTQLEKIDCSFVITVKTADLSANTFTCDLQVQSRRPVFNSVYTTSLFNFKDPSFDFSYVESDPLQFTENRSNGNLTAVMAFYAYILLGVDQDSFSPFGGTAYFNKASEIMSQAQSNNLSGWGAFENAKNRYALVSAFTDEASKGFRQMWYTYHRKGLDEMSTNTDKPRAAIAESLTALKTLNSDRPGSVLLSIFSDTKIEEVRDIFSKGLTSEKESVHQILSDVFPAQANRYSSILQ
ncbi:MAG: DUF4835 family protein [Bacteroidota bacterium]|nr:DUF4835 family protein [Bacteroidota bacterium]